MKLYTKKGDDGRTELFGGQSVGKDSLRVAVYGTVDELNSTLGLAAAVCKHAEISQALGTLQNRLFDLGADLATPRQDGDKNKPSAISRIDETHVTQAERMIDAACSRLPEMRQFILPGGSEVAARLHVSRAVCRRAERECVTLSKQEDLGPWITIYLNRVGDLLFALARRANQLDGLPDVPWQKT
ncbi:MAG: cob(I)yrinic acid a,c-diamide adenosyltransferase [Phycisphaeraceae bacterium]|nr:cob(I)yrinic acid a,c-diamide adenosyltransferase [Phycisphaeraceae bacterium]